MKEFLKKLWGADQPRSFKLTSWGLALTCFAGYLYYQQTKEFNITEWNDKIKQQEKEKLKKIENVK
jgi:hypothetical protein